MSKNILYIILTLGLLFCFSFEAFAVRAYPYPIKVTQPDGTTITIQVHGDEFLSWTTSGNNLVSKGKDGFYYLASFKDDGTVSLSNTKASGASSISFTSGSNSVTPPPAAFARAMKMRSEMAQLSSLPDTKGSSNSQSISIGENHFLVLLIEFPDLPFTVADVNASFNNMLNEPGYSKNGGTGSAKDYYEDNSNGQFKPIFDVIGPIKVSKGYAHYSKDKGLETPGARELLIEACDSVDNSVDFSKYDHNNDGVIDDVFFYFAGHNMAEGADGTIWPHRWSIFHVNKMLDGRRLYQYACASEYSGYTGDNMAGIGTFCHEFGHVIGLPDVYDTSTERSNPGMYNYSLMSSGNYNNGGKTPPYITSVERIILGWSDGHTLLSESGNYSPKPLADNFSYYSPTTNEGEYFVYEYRPSEGWDKYINPGLLIYHVDKSNNLVGGLPAWSRWYYQDGINEIKGHQCMDIVEAYDGYISSYAQIPFPGSTNNTSFTSSTSPAAKDWAGNPTGFYLTNIKANGSFILSRDNIISGKVSNTNNTPLAGITLTFTYQEPSNSSVASFGSLQAAPFNASNSIYSVVTDNDGNFNFKTEKTGNFMVSIQASGYSAYNNALLFDGGLLTYNITLRKPAEMIGIQMKKHNDQYDVNPTGIERPSDYYAAVGYTVAELEEHVGSAINSISFMAVSEDNKVDEMGVMVYFNNQVVHTQKLPEIVFGSFVTVDISAANLSIPANSSVMFAYYLKNCNYSYPIALDIGPSQTLGDLLSFDGKEWMSLSDSGFNCNILVGASITNNNKIFYYYGFNTIKSPKKEYAVGDEFTLQLVESNTPPSSVKWSFDGVAQPDGYKINLSAGKHTVKAELTYSNGNTETLLLEIEAK